MKPKIPKGPQCVHMTEEKPGRCTRCSMPCSPLNHIRFWSPFMQNVSKITLKSNYAEFANVIVNHITPAQVPSGA
jgi:hypothetical protein